MRYDYKSALIVGAGTGFSASLARLLHREAGMRIGLAARSLGKLDALVADTGAIAVACDATNPAEVDALFETMERRLDGPPDVVVYNASARGRGPFVDLDSELVAQALAVSAFGGFLVAQRAARRMCAQGRGARPHGAARRARLHARSRRDRARLSRRVAAGPQRMDLGDRVASLGRTLLRLCFWNELP
jgi:NAD(P)-dependent dehydrogenase (short-subunit alcohol dehydrogenase family)